MGLMKIATYYRKLGDDVRFFKGDLRDLAVEIIMERLIKHFATTQTDLPIKKYYTEIFEFIKRGQRKCLIGIEEFRKDNVPDEIDNDIYEALKEYHKKYKANDYKNSFDIVCVTTLFTFTWAVTIDTIKFAKKLCKCDERVFVGGIASSIVPDEIYKETGISPIVGMLDKPGMLGDNNNLIVENQPLDYSILDEIDYKYPATDAYFAYMTRGCPNRCAFCAVPTLEPEYCGYISLKEQMEFTRKHYGEKRNLLLLDNNVLASDCFEKIVDEIKEMGFSKGEKYLPENEYEIAYRSLMDGIKYNEGVVGYNDRAFIRKIVNLYQETLKKLKGEEAGHLYQLLEESNCLTSHSASKESIAQNDIIFRETYNKIFRPKLLVRYVDFNQGIEGKLLTDDKMKKLAEIHIRPLRIAFDYIAQKNSYEASIRLAAKYGVTNLSNYMLYNHKDKPEDLYVRMKLNIDLCVELGISIYSFPMKYHPISDPAWFRNRNYLGDNWNRKFIRAIQAVLNSTKGKIGKGKSFFEEAFGESVEEFQKILWMPEAFIIYRRKHDEMLREKLSDRYTNYDGSETNLTNDWWNKWCKLDSDTLSKVKKIISNNIFTNETCETGDAKVDEMLAFYLIRRE